MATLTKTEKLCNKFSVFYDLISQILSKGGHEQMNILLFNAISGTLHENCVCVVNVNINFPLKHCCVTLNIFM
jgi:hypothetical protein